jgi:hypothetical protein
MRRRRSCKGGGGQEAVHDQGLGGEREEQSREQVSSHTTHTVPAERLPLEQLFGRRNAYPEDPRV